MWRWYVLLGLPCWHLSRSCWRFGFIIKEKSGARLTPSTSPRSRWDGFGKLFEEPIASEVIFLPESQHAIVLEVSARGRSEVSITPTAGFVWSCRFHRFLVVKGVHPSWQALVQVQVSPQKDQSDSSPSCGCDYRSIGHLYYG